MSERPKRICDIQRDTTETRVKLSLNLDGSGKASIETGVGFFNHMLELFARHGLFDLSVQSEGDLQVDSHHTVEDVGIVLGEALAKALGDKRGINRYGDALVPMDESLAQVVVDLSGRSATVLHLPFNSGKVGQFDVELVEEFLKALAANARMNLHVNVLYGSNNHHMAEAVFKALARALRRATEFDPRNTQIPSTKGKL